MNFQNLTQRLLKKKPLPYRRQRILVNPKRDWAMGASLFSIFTLLLLLLAGYLFYEVKQGDLFVIKETESEQVVRLNQKTLYEVITRYREKAERFEALRTGEPASYTDPSK